MFKKIKHSFSARLSFYITLFVMLLFSVGFSAFFHYSSQSLERNTYEKVSQIATNADLRVATLLNAVQKIPDNMQWIITAYSCPDSLFAITRKIVTNNPEVFGCAIAFEPNHFKSEGYYFAPYSYMKDDSVVTKQIGSDEYNYFQKNWYKIAKEKGISRWSKPYKDMGGADTLISTYSVPIRDLDNNIIGIFSIDLSTSWLTELVNSTRPFPNSYTLVIDKQGNYIVGKKEEIHKTFFYNAAQMDDPKGTLLAHRMTEGKSGSMVFDDNGVKSFVYYAPMTSTDWYMGIVCPYNEMFQRLNDFNKVVIAFFILTLILIYLLCSVTISQLTTPLKVFAAYARSIEDGHFDAPLPEIRTKDEMRELHHSFRYMQQKLSEHIANLEATTIAKGKIESELRIAHDIQMGMLPKTFPPFPERKEVDIYAVLNPAREVGGDLYDFFIIDDDFYFVIGDVSGKGVPASLMMAVTTTLLRSVLSRHVGPAYINTALNDNLSATSKTDMFVTFFVGMLNLITGVLRYSNAGHTPPIITHPDHTSEFFNVPHSLPLGVMAGYGYTEQVCTLAPGSALLLYTDGVTDAENSERQFYTRERLLDTVCRNNLRHPQEFINGIIADINAHVKDAAQTDDITMLTFVYGRCWNTTENNGKM